MSAEETKAMTQIRTQDEASHLSMQGKTVLFTGASRGMGRFAVIELARRGAQIFVVGHNDARGSAAVEAIRGIGGSAEFLRADMGDADDVCSLAEEVLARDGSINVLIHSAGGLPPSAARTREGVDRGFAQNFLGAFLLTRLLEERLLASAPVRVIAVGSSTDRMVKKLDLDAFIHPQRCAEEQLTEGQLPDGQLPDGQVRGDYLDIRPRAPLGEPGRHRERARSSHGEGRVR
jgi:nucleoside-diphosphate-sugar epimerase